MYDEDATYDRRLQERAARLIIARCESQAAAAADALRSRSDAGRQARLDRIIPIALRDAGAWGDADRELLARAMSPAAKTVLEIPDPAATTPGGGILTDHNLGVSVLVPPTAPAAPGDADAQVEAVLDVLAPKSEAIWFIDQDPAEPVRVPIIRLEYQGQAVMPNDEQMRDLARAIVTAIRTASGAA